MNPTSAQRQSSEKDRRDLAQTAAGEPVDVVGELAPKELRQMLSLRVEPALARELRAVADERGITVSELLREAAARQVAEHRATHWRVRFEPVADSSVKLDRTTTDSGTGWAPTRPRDGTDVRLTG